MLMKLISRKEPETNTTEEPKLILVPDTVPTFACADN